MKFSAMLLLVLSAAASIVVALSPTQWRAQSIYQIVTDRFARTDGSTTAECNLDEGVYCGGTWRGIINKLGYIQGVGFTAVSTYNSPESELSADQVKIWISPIVHNLEGNSADG